VSVSESVFVFVFEGGQRERWPGWRMRLAGTGSAVAQPG